MTGHVLMIWFICIDCVYCLYILFVLCLYMLVMVAGAGFCFLLYFPFCFLSPLILFYSLNSPLLCTFMYIFTLPPPLSLSLSLSCSLSLLLSLSLSLALSPPLSLPLSLFLSPSSSLSLPPLSPCSHMSEGDINEVRKSVLERCRHIGSVVHIYIDKRSSHVSQLKPTVSMSSP